MLSRDCHMYREIIRYVLHNDFFYYCAKSIRLDGYTKCTADNKKCNF